MSFCSGVCCVVLGGALVQGRTPLPVPDGAGGAVAAGAALPPAGLVPFGFPAGAAAGRGAVHVLLAVPAAHAYIEGWESVQKLTKVESTISHVFLPNYY